MKVKHGKSVIWLFLKIALRTTISMESSRRDLFIGMVVDRYIFNSNQDTPSPCFTYMPKPGVGLPKIGVSLYYVYYQNNLGKNSLKQVFRFCCEVRFKLE